MDVVTKTACTLCPEKTSQTLSIVTWRRIVRF